MKQIGLLALTILASLTQIQAQTKKVKEEMSFDKTVDGLTFHDYGSIVFGANGKVEFTYTNQGTKPLVISDVKSSCGCTIPNWTKEPVAPGQKGTIKIEYNTTLPGVFNKTVEVYSNANNSPVRISIRGKVNTQPSDLKPGKTKDARSQNQNIVMEGEDNQAIPQDSALKAQAAAVSNAKKAAQQESFKKLLDQPSPTQQTGAPQTGTAFQQSVMYPVKKK
ncbi:MAG: DUF1573 domain-containing protein [Porphyromonadaceae bacterium]|nr:MAG: DUF1573 domain-containing protein [Porphyromonadaceae bacterium]